MTDFLDDLQPTEIDDSPREGISPYVPFPDELLPDPLAKYVSNAAAAIGVDSSMIALPLLSGVAGAVGNARRVRVKAGWLEPMIIWTATIGHSGEKKSPAQDAALEAMKSRQSRALDEAAEQEVAYQTDMEHHRAELADWSRSGRKKGEPKPEAPEPPQAWRCLASDTTIEAVAKILDRNPRGILVYRDELSAWLGSFDRYKKGGQNSDVVAWLEMHRGGRLLVDRASAEKPTLHIRRASVSVTGSVQPPILRQCLGSTYVDNGLSARFLYAAPPRRRKVWSDDEVDGRLTAELTRLFDGLFDLGFDPNADDPHEPVTVDLTPAGKKRFIRFYDEHNSRHAELSPAVQAAFSKLEGYGARLALLIHTVRLVNGDTRSHHIGAEEVDLAAKLVAWFAAETERVYSRLSEPDETAHLRELLDHLHIVGPSSPREIRRKVRRFGDVDAIARKLEALRQMGAVEKTIDGIGTPGRPTERYQPRIPGGVVETPANSGNNGFHLRRQQGVSEIDTPEPDQVADGWEV